MVRTGRVALIDRPGGVPTFVTSGPLYLSSRRYVWAIFWYNRANGFMPLSIRFMSKLKEWRELSKLVRYNILKSTTAAGSGHPSSSLSATDLMTTLMFGGFFRARLDVPLNPLNDRLIFSKGHAAPLLYSLYAVAGKVSEHELMQLRKFHSPLEGHPTMRFPYTESPTGSLGQGLSVGLGLALNAKYLDRTSYRTFVLLGDSEMAEGSNWETMQLAAYYELNNLIGIIDVNALGQRGVTMYAHDLEIYESKVKAFGWKTIVVDGHNHREIAKAYQLALKEQKRPVMIIAGTVKGKGVSFIENKNGWHGRALNKEECDRALRELGEVDKNLEGKVAAPTAHQIKQVEEKIHLKKTHYELGELVATRTAYGEGLVEIFPHHKNMVVLDAEVSNSTEAAIFNEHYPEHFFEMFIAEQNMVGAAIGFSRMGKIPFVSTFAAFFARAADQIRMSGYSDSNIKFVGSHAGCSIGQDGASQMGLEDLAMFRSQKQTVVLYPSDAVSMVLILGEAAKHQGNVYLRTTRQKTPVIYRETDHFKIGGSKTLKQSSGDVVTVVAAGITLHEALKAHDQLLEEGIAIRVIDLYSVQPLDLGTLQVAAHETKAIITVEDHYEAGGIGEAVSTALSTMPVPVYRLAVGKRPQSGTPEELMAYEEIDAGAIVKKVRGILV